MASENNNITEEKKSLNFIEAKVEKDLAEGKNGGRIQTRFPPEPNGYHGIPGSLFISQPTYDCCRYHRRTLGHPQNVQQQEREAGKGS